jgi:LacI family transcriptional regulator
MIANAIPISRRSLEWKFRAVLKRSLLEEVRRVRVEMAKELLSGTDLAMPAVAQKSGFANAQRLALIFRRLTGSSPAAYRRNSRANPP